MLQAVHGWSSTYERLVKSQKFFSSYLTQEDFSRFGRNSIEVGYFMERVFPIYGIRFISLNDEYDSAKYHEDTGGINVAFKYLISEFYSRDLSVKYMLRSQKPFCFSGNAHVVPASAKSDDDSVTSKTAWSESYRMVPFISIKSSV